MTESLHTDAEDALYDTTPRSTPRLCVTRGSPWRVDEERRERWSASPFLRKHARPIVQIGDPILLRKTSKPRMDPEALEELAGILFASMLMAQGVGIAAPQIGIPLRVAIMDIDRAGLVVVDPRVQTTSQERRETVEGCLSVRNLSGRVRRPRRASATALDIEGRRFSLEGVGSGAQVILHEIDHLDGHLYLERTTPDKLFTYDPDDDDEKPLSEYQRSVLARQLNLGAEWIAARA